MKPDPESSERGRQARQLSAAMMIPALFAAGPLVCGGLAWLAVRYWHWPQGAIAIGILVGLAAGALQVYHAIRDMNR